MDLTQEAKLAYLAGQESGLLLDRYGHLLNLRRAQASTTLPPEQQQALEQTASAAIAQLDEMLAIIASERASIQQAAPTATTPAEPTVTSSPQPSQVDPGT